MLPQIRPRIYTEALLQKNHNKISSSVFVKSRIKQSSIKACKPYIYELKHSSNRCSPKFSTHNSKSKSKKVNKIFTQAVQNEEFKQKNKPSFFSRKQTKNYDSNDDTTLQESTIQVKNPINSKAKQNKIHSLLRQFQRITKQIQQHSKDQPPVTNTLNSKKFLKCIEQYQNLPKNKLSWNESTVAPFFQSLSRFNPFAKKIKPIIILCLLKVGKIKRFQQNQMIQWQQGQYSKMIGLLLWGQVLIKSQKNKMKIYLFSGDSFNEELIFQKDKFQHILPDKNSEIMKAKTQTAILFIKLRDYHLVYQQLVKAGQKNSILLAENMMKWSYAKKKNTRREFSHL